MNMKYLHELDYEEAAELLNEEFTALGVRSAIRGGYLVADTYPQDERWDRYEYNVEFRSAHPRPSIVSFRWQHGIGIVTQTATGQTIPKPPNPAEVFGSACRDAVEAAESSYPDWASNLGYERDSVKARKIYDQCIEEGEKLRHLGLSVGQIKRFAEIARCL